MKKLFLILFCAILVNSCKGVTQDELIVKGIKECKCPQKYQVDINGDMVLFTNKEYKINDTLR